MKTFIRTAAFVFVALGFATEAVAQAQTQAPGGESPQVATAFDSLKGHGVASAGAWMEVGAFERLTAADRKIAEAIFNSQSVTASGSAPMSLDQIATVRRHGGWKAVLSWMKMDGLTAAKNLRDLLAHAKRKREREANSATMVKARVTVVTNGNGDRIILYSRTPAESAESSPPKPPRKPTRKMAHQSGAI